MAFRVEVSPQAYDDLDAIADYIQVHGSFERAELWFNEMIQAIASLEDMPHRCPLAEGSAYSGKEVRVFLHGERRQKYKVYFSIFVEKKSTGVVQVLHVRHWAQRALRVSELEKLLREEAESEHSPEL